MEKFKDSQNRVFKILKNVYLIPTLFEVFMAIMFVLGMFVNLEKENFLFPTNDVIMVSVLVVLMILSIIFLNTNLKITGCIMGLVPQIPLAVIFARQCEDPYYYDKLLSIYYWRHLIPVILMTAILVWLLGIKINEKLDSKRQEKIYDKQF